MELWKELLSDKEIIKDDCNLTMIKYVKDLNKLDGNDFKNDFKNNFEKQLQFFKQTNDMVDNFYKISNVY